VRKEQSSVVLFSRSRSLTSLKMLSAPSIRIGGNSCETSWWDPNHEPNPPRKSFIPATYQSPPSSTNIKPELRSSFYLISRETKHLHKDVTYDITSTDLMSLQKFAEVTVNRVSPPLILTPLVKGYRWANGPFVQLLTSK